MRLGLLVLQQLVILVSGKTTLHLGGLFILSGEDLLWAGSVYPGVLMALEDINNRDDILADYHLEIITNDTKGDAGIAIHTLIEMALTPPTKIMLIGGAQGEESIALAETSKWWNMLQVVPATMTPVLSDRERFPLSFRMRMSFLMFSDVRLAILKHFGWERIGIIYTNDQTILTTMRALTQALLEANITLVSSDQFISQVPPSYQVKKLKDAGVRIVIALTLTYIDTRLLMCEAYKQGMIGPRYVWMTHGHSSYRFWLDEDPLVSCTVEEVSAAMEGHLTVGDTLFRPDGKMTLSGVARSDFEERYEALTTSLDLGFMLGLYHTMGYDGIWTIALALNSSIGKLPDGKRLEDFTYNDKRMRDVFFDEMSKTKFEGMGGPVLFDETGDREGIITIRQIKNDTFEEKGLFYQDTNELIWFTPPDWGGSIPHDRQQEIQRPLHIKPALFYVVLVLSLCGIIFALVLLAFNIHYRELKYIKMSSPNINNIIICGCVILYVSAISFGFDDNSVSDDMQKDMICMPQAWLLSIGFTISFGAMFSKTWRIHKIFTNKTLITVKIRDWRLLLHVVYFMIADVIILLTWYIIDPPTAVTVELPKQAAKNGEDSVYLPMAEVCVSKYINVWLGLMCGYKGVIILFGVFLAYETRKVKYTVLNDSRYIGFAVYNVLVMSMMGVPTVMVMQPEQVEAKFMISALCIIFCTTATLCLVFVPKMLELRHATVVDPAPASIGNMPSTFASGSSAQWSTMTSRLSTTKGGDTDNTLVVPVVQNKAVVISHGVPVVD